MKKLFLSLVALAAIFASCSKSDVVSVPFENIPISFNPYSGRTPEVKSTSFANSEDSLNTFTFHAMGFLNENSLYMDKVVKREDATDENGDDIKIWNYEGVAYWPGTKELEFLAYGLNTKYNGNNNVTLAEDNRSLDVVVPTNIYDQRDLLVAGAQTKAYSTAAGGGTVNLVFKHMFARIQFTLKTVSKKPVDVSIEDLYIKGSFSQSGRVDLTSETPAIVADAATADVVYSLINKEDGESFTGNASDGTPIFDNSSLWNKVTNNTASETDDYYKAVENASTATADANKDQRYMMIIPTETHNAGLYVQYFLPYAGTMDQDMTTPDVVEPISLSSVKFEAGKSYNFVLEVTTNSIDFSVEITDWVDGSTAIGEAQTIKLN